MADPALEENGGGDAHTHTDTVNDDDVENQIIQGRSGKVTGIIYPPPDIRAVVDKTAQWYVCMSICMCMCVWRDRETELLTRSIIIIISTYTYTHTHVYTYTHIHTGWRAMANPSKNASSTLKKGKVPSLIS